MEKQNILYNLKVLYVEDEEIIREELASFIKRRVGKLIIAVDGEDGLLKFNEHRPDLVITDLKMPKMNGIEMAKNIRNMDDICSIIITTAISDVDSIMNTIDIGIDKYVIKPINTKELVDTMEKAAVRLYKIKAKETIINSMLFEKDAKKELENKVQKEIARFLKHYTGKGPRNVDAFIQGDRLTIQCFETRTIYEKALLDNPENIRLVNYNRELFFKDKGKEIESNIKDILHTSIQMDEVITDSRLDIDQIKFKINCL